MFYFCIVNVDAVLISNFPEIFVSISGMFINPAQFFSLHSTFRSVCNQCLSLEKREPCQ